MVDVRKANIFDYIRFVMSALILLFSAIVTSYAIIERQTGFYHAVPGYAALILFVVDLFILGVVEGLQIALVELKRQHPDSYKRSHPGAYRLGQIAAKGDNVERFLMGRQVFVVFLVFFAAKLTTIHLEEGEKFLFPAPSWFRSVFLETGILACVIVVIIAQLMPQIIAAKFPVHFLELIIMRPAYYICVFVETTGLTHICWVLSAAFGYVLGMRDDEFQTDDREGVATVDGMIKDIESSLDTMKPDTDKTSSDPKKINQGDVLDVAKTSMGQDQYRQFEDLMENITKELDPNALVVMRYYLDNHPEKFRQFPTVIGGRMYPSPHSIAQGMERAGAHAPQFLSDISDPNHVPPHIAAVELLEHNHALRGEVDELRRVVTNLKKTRL